LLAAFPKAIYYSAFRLPLPPVVSSSSSIFGRSTPFISVALNNYLREAKMNIRSARSILISATVRLHHAADDKMTVFIRASVCVWSLLQWGAAYFLFFFSLFSI
jgi:hypothetical protein